MEQIFMIEVFAKRIVVKIEPPEKDPEELEKEAEERKKAEEAAAAAVLAALAGKGKKKKGKGGSAKGRKGKKGKKGKKTKESIAPSEEELKYMQTCTMQVDCLPVFDFFVAHDNFVAPPPPPPPAKKKKKRKGKGKKKPTLKVKKKGRRGKKKKGLPPRKIALPSEPLPQPPFFGVGNACIFINRPKKLEEILRKTPINITVWNRDQDMNCMAYCCIVWHDSFFDILKQVEEANPINMESVEYRITDSTKIFTNTVELTRNLHCQEDLRASGKIEFYIKLTCLGNKLVTHFVSFPELERLPGRKYLNDEHKFKDVEIVRHWEGTQIETIPPVIYFFSAPDITKNPIIPVEKEVGYEEYVAPFTQSELAILAMGFPKGPCGGTNCPKRMDFRGSQHQFIFGDKTKQGKYQPGQFVNKRDVHGPCGRLDCPLAKKVRAYLCSEGAYKPCMKPCCQQYY